MIRPGARRDLKSARPQVCNGYWGKWAGVISGDLVLTGTPGDWDWVEVIDVTRDGEVTIRWADGTDYRGVPPADGDIYIDPVARRATDRDHADAVRLVRDVLGGVEIEGD
jgi:hypothetical protein